jgi:hypothetical protein
VNYLTYLKNVVNILLYILWILRRYRDILSVGEEIQILFFMRLSFHFAMTLEDAPLGDSDDGGGKVPMEFSRGMDFHPPSGIHFSFHLAVDD